MKWWAETFGRILSAASGKYPAIKKIGYVVFNVSKYIDERGNPTVDLSTVTLKELMNEPEEFK